MLSRQSPGVSRRSRSTVCSLTTETDDSRLLTADYFVGYNGTRMGMNLPGAVALALAAMTAAGAQAQPNVDELLVRVGERVAEFYKRAKNVICIETSTVQPVDFNNSPEGFARTVESELRFEADNGQTPGEAAIVRKVRKVNGRVPREKDKKDRAGCTDPNPLSSEPLAFLLPAHRSEYQFRTAGIGERQEPDCPDDRFRVGGSQEQPRADRRPERTRRLLRLVGAHRIEGTHLGGCRKLRRVARGAGSRRAGRREGPRVDTTPLPSCQLGSHRAGRCDDSL